MRRRYIPHQSRSRFYGGDGSKWLADMASEERKDEEMPQFQRRGPIPRSQQSHTVWDHDKLHAKQPSWPFAVAVAFGMLCLLFGQFS